MVWTEAPTPSDPPCSLALDTSSCCSSSSGSTSSSSSPALEFSDSSPTPTILLTPSTPTSPPIHLAVRRVVSKMKECDYNQRDGFPQEDFSYPDTSSIYSQFQELDACSSDPFSDQVRMNAYLRNKNIFDQEVESIIMPDSPSTISSPSTSSSSSPLSPRFFNPYLPLSPSGSL
ncbi:hypothetical protein FHG87_020510, partial [Trinorchestia longiramus]